MPKKKSSSSAKSTTEHSHAPAPPVRAMLTSRRERAHRIVVSIGPHVGVVPACPFPSPRRHPLLHDEGDVNSRASAATCPSVPIQASRAALCFSPQSGERATKQALSNACTFQRLLKVCTLKTAATARVCSLSSDRLGDAPPSSSHADAAFSTSFSAPAPAEDCMASAADCSSLPWSSEAAASGSAASQHQHQHQQHDDSSMTAAASSPSSSPLPPPSAPSSPTASRPVAPSSSQLGRRSVGVDYGLRRTGVCVSVGYAPRPLPLITHNNQPDLVARWAGWPGL